MDCGLCEAALRSDSMGRLNAAPTYYAAAWALRNSSVSRATLPVIECNDGAQPMARDRGARTTWSSATASA